MKKPKSNCPSSLVFYGPTVAILIAIGWLCYSTFPKVEPLRYADKVLIVNGFYKGWQGCVYDHNSYSDEYGIKFVSYIKRKNLLLYGRCVVDELGLVAGPQNYPISPKE